MQIDDLAVRISTHALLSCWLAASALAVGAISAESNRFCYLDEFCDPYYVGTDFPKLTTPQWVGEPGVDAVVVLAIDDMRQSEPYEVYLRPILDRLKQIDGRAAVSIMTNEAKPSDEQLQRWLAEGVSIEVHTLDHPCPLLKDGDFPKAFDTYTRCIDLLETIPGNRAVAFRMPCCDSLNSPSPRFYAETFSKRTANDNFLAVDSSIFNIITANDQQLPREWVVHDDGTPRFEKYVPFKSFVNTIENYPYPYVIGNTCWEFPCMVPSDWQAQNLQQPNNPNTVRDWQTALDVVVRKQGIFNLVFHPHGWIRAQQIVEFVDYAANKYGQRVKFLTFREALQRLNRHLLGGHSLRSPSGLDHGVRMLDLNGDGLLDVVIGADGVQVTRLWDPEKRTWRELPAPGPVVRRDNNHTWPAARFGQIDGAPIVALRDDKDLSFFRFRNSGWQEMSGMRRGIRLPEDLLQLDGDIGLRLRDFDDDATSELVIANEQLRATYSWNASAERWVQSRAALPVPLVRAGRDAGVRFVDLNADGHDELVHSDEATYGVFRLAEGRWHVMRRGSRDDNHSIPPIARNGRNNGAWFHSDHLWVQNEHTARLPDYVDRVPFDELMELKENRANQPTAPSTVAGASRIDITPDGPIRLAGYAVRKTESEGVAHRLFAKALAIGSDESDPAVIITVDTLGIPAEITDTVAARLQQERGLPPDRLNICASHTHAAPVVNGVAPTLFGERIPEEHQARIDAYTRSLTDKLVRVACEALDQCDKAHLSWSESQATFAANRRQANGPVDHRVPVLRVNRLDGTLAAVLVKYACHCTTLSGENYRVHADWAGIAQAEVEKAHPGCVALVAIGCGADSNPRPRGTIALAEQHGRALAAAVERALAKPGKPLTGPLRCRQAVVQLPYDTLPTRAQWEERARQGSYAGYHARVNLARLDRGEPLPTTLPYRVAAWTFGNDLAMIFLAGEVVVDYALRLREEFRGERLWINAYCNDLPCYIPSARVWQEGGYEAGDSMVYFDRPNRLTPQAEQLIVDTVQQLLPAEFYSNEKQRNFPPPKSPADAANSFRLPAGLNVEIAAAEPLVVDPVAFDWGPDGRLWVAEMCDYPTGVGNSGSPAGRVKVLTDGDGDGRYDRADVFLDDLSFPTGVKVWRDGVLVTAAPHVLYAEDTDGDHRADISRVVYEGFGEGNPQHRVNGLRWGIDNWLYLGNGDSGGTVTSIATNETVETSGRDLRIRPDRGLLTLQSGRTQFGRTQDDWGNWFGGNNTIPIWHYVLDDHYLANNPHLRPPRVWKSLVNGAEVFPASRTLARFNDWHAANRFTSACSPEIYRDRLLGDEFYGNAFICEPVHNLVHREVVTEDGYSFSGHRTTADSETEFLTSTDNWFRPAMVRTGPDGALWIADMYRFVIEHPEWIPRDWQRKLDLRAGETRGRIYRVVPANSPPARLPQLDRLEPGQLVSLLESPNGVVRDLAQQLLIWQENPSATQPLVRLASNSSEPLGRLHALCTLDGLGELTSEIVERALADAHPGVRRHAVRLAEQYGGDATIGQKLRALAIDTHPQLRMQLAYTLRYFPPDLAGVTLASLVRAEPTNQNLLAAALSSVTESTALEFVVNALQRGGEHDLVGQAAQEIARVTSLTVNPQGAGRVLAACADYGLPAATSAAEALRGRDDVSLRELFTPEVRALFVALDEQATRRAVDVEASDVDRVAALDWLRCAAVQKPDLDSLVNLITAATPPAVQSAAFEALAANAKAKQIAEIAVAAWLSATPELRSEMFAALLAEEESTDYLLKEIEAGGIDPAELNTGYRDRLLDHSNESVRHRAEALFRRAESNRDDVVRQFESALALPTNLERGKTVFAKSCAACHRLHERGETLGPDLAALTNRSPHALLVAILDPNRAMEDKFANYVATTEAGRQITGMLTQETSVNVTLHAGQGNAVSIGRSELVELRNTGMSLMPEGLERDLLPQQLADVIAYVRSAGPSPKAFPNNAPTTITANEGETLVLPATACQIYGSRLEFEQRHQNLGWWLRPDDRGIWSLVVPQAGMYDVAIEYACHENSAGNLYQITIAGNELQGEVESTETWDHYVRRSAGTVELPKGHAELSLRSAGSIEGELFHLRSVLLTPEQTK